MPDDSATENNMITVDKDVSVWGVTGSNRSKIHTIIYRAMKCSDITRRILGDCEMLPTAKRVVICNCKDSYQDNRSNDIDIPTCVESLIIIDVGFQGLSILNSNYKCESALKELTLINTRRMRVELGILRELKHLYMFNAWIYTFHSDLSTTKLETLYMHNSTFQERYRTSTKKITIPRTIQYAHIDIIEHHLAPPNRKEKTLRNSLARLSEYDLVYNSAMMSAVNISKCLKWSYKMRLKDVLIANFEKYVMSMYGIRLLVDYEKVVKLGYLAE